MIEGALIEPDIFDLSKIERNQLLIGERLHQRLNPGIGFGHFSHPLIRGLAHSGIEALVANRRQAIGVCFLSLLSRCTNRNLKAAWADGPMGISQMGGQPLVWETATGILSHVGACEMVKQTFLRSGIEECR